MYFTYGKSMFKQINPLKYHLQTSGLFRFCLFSCSLFSLVPHPCLNQINVKGLKCKPFWQASLLMPRRFDKGRRLEFNCSKEIWDLLQISLMCCYLSSISTRNEGLRAMSTYIFDVQGRGEEKAVTKEYILHTIKYYITYNIFY